MIFKLYHLPLLAALLCISMQAGAGIFNDDEARAQIQLIETRLSQLDELLARYEQSDKKQSRTILDLQSQIEGQNDEIRKLRGLNEELSHNLQDIEKRQREINVDHDNRVRRLEAIERANADKANSVPTVSVPAKIDDPIANENRAFDAAFAFYKTEHYQNAAPAFQEFLRNYPQSTHTADIYYWLGFSNYVLKDYKGSLAAYQNLQSKFSKYPKLPDALLNMSDCQLELKDKAGAKLTLKAIIDNFPGSDAAKEAKKQLAQLK
jgi:tol-pal system protein YbgF